MKTVIYFSHEVNKTPVSLSYIMYGRYEEAGFIFIEEKELVIFDTKHGQEYQKYIYNRNNELNIAKMSVVFLLLNIDNEETRKLRASCEACVLAHKPFNMKDVLLMQVPFRIPEEYSMYLAPTLNNTQAIILIMRESLNSDNPLLLAIKDLHSRQTILDVLYNCIKPSCKSISENKPEALLLL
jgi:hypothetical protein